MVRSRGEGVREEGGEGAGTKMKINGDLTWGGEHTMQYVVQAFKISEIKFSHILPK